MADLKTHEARMAAMEEAFDQAVSGIEKAQIVQVAAALERDNFFAQKDRDALLQNASAFQQVQASGKCN